MKSSPSQCLHSKSSFPFRPHPATKFPEYPYINGVSEVPLSYVNELCFKMLGDLGASASLPDEVLMICFGGGIAAGTTTLLPEVKSLTIVDLESSVLDSAKFLAKENNHVLDNPKTRVVIDDGRNFILTSQRRCR